MSKNNNENSPEQSENIAYKSEQDLANIEKPLLDDLRSVGVNVSSAWDLTEPYPNAIPVLLKHLREDYPDWIRSGIARALGTPLARYAWNDLVELFNNIEFHRNNIGNATKAGLAVALGLLVDDTTLDELIALARDVRHGTARIMFLRSIKKMKRPDIPKILEELSKDDDLILEISSWKAYWKKHNPALLEFWNTPSEKKRRQEIERKLRNE